jgi:hypothetical protein
VLVVVVVEDLLAGRILMGRVVLVEVVMVVKLVQVVPVLLVLPIQEVVVEVDLPLQGREVLVVQVL